MRYFKQMPITTTTTIVTQIMAHEFISIFKLTVVFCIFLNEAFVNFYLKKISNAKNTTNFIT